VLLLKMMEAELLEASGAAGGSSLAAKVATVDGKVDTLISQVSTMQDSIQQLLLGRGAGVLHERADTEAATQLHPGSKLHPLAHAVGSSQKTIPEKTLFDEKGEVDGSGRDGGGGRGGINEGVNGHEQLMEPLMEPSHLFDQDGGMIRPGEKTSFSTESLTRTASRSPPTLDPVRITVPLETAPRRPSVSANGNHALETQGRGSHRRGRSRESRHKSRQHNAGYNRFIHDEIARIMDEDPTIDHKGAFMLAHRASLHLISTGSPAEHEDPRVRQTRRFFHEYEDDFERARSQGIGQRRDGEEAFRRAQSVRLRPESRRREGRSRDRM